MQKKKIPLGLSNFKKLIIKNAYFVDKSLFIKDVEENLCVSLFTRPRRFGKTLNLSMLKYFYDLSDDNSSLFEGLQISQEAEIMEKQGKHPVIYLTLKDVKRNTWEGCYTSIKRIMSTLFCEFEYLLDSDCTNRLTKASIQRIITETADYEDYTYSLKMLSEALSRYHKADTIILIDEYDTPIHEAFYKGYYEEIIQFMRIFMGATFKDNDYLEKAVITGILRVSKESMFSGLNNLDVCTISDLSANDKFGFTEPEVVDMLEYYDNIFYLDDIKHWYNGYNFKGAEIYNPWSILSSVKKKDLSTHWINTSGNDLVKDLCLKADKTVKKDLDILTQGGSLFKKIESNIVFNDLGKDNNVLWSFLLHTGYLRYDNLVKDKDGWSTWADLSIPNLEVLSLFVDDIIKYWFKPPYNEPEITRLTNILLAGDVSIFGSDFQQYCLDAVSYYDISGDEPEQCYHNIVIGILYCLRRICHIKSNRESGLGRYDIMLYPKDQSQFHRGVIFEFKKVNTEKGGTFEKALTEAKDQIKDNKYNQELLAMGFEEIINVAMAFVGKDVRVGVS